jgi:hypothetical protein
LKSEEKRREKKGKAKTGSIGLKPTTYIEKRLKFQWFSMKFQCFSTKFQCVFKADLDRDAAIASGCLAEFASIKEG